MLPEQWVQLVRRGLKVFREIKEELGLLGLKARRVQRARLDHKAFKAQKATTDIACFLVLRPRSTVQMAEQYSQTPEETRLPSVALLRAH